MADRDRAKTFWRPEITSQEPYFSLNCSILSPEIPLSLERLKMLDRSLEKQENQRRFLEIQRPCHTDLYNYSWASGR